MNDLAEPENSTTALQLVVVTSNTFANSLLTGN